MSCVPRDQNLCLFLKAIQPQLRAHNRYLIAYLGIDTDSTQQIMSTQYISVVQNDPNVKQLP